MSRNVDISCTECGQIYEIKDEEIGEIMNCSECDAEFEAVECEDEDIVEVSIPEKKQKDSNAVVPAVKLSRTDFKDEMKITHPDTIMAKVQGGSITKTVLLSTVVHVVLLTIFSIGYIRNAVHYKTLFPQGAIEEEAKEKRLAEKKAAAELKQKEKEKKEAEAAIAAKQLKAQTKPQVQNNEPGKSKIEKELNETSDERPKASSLDSIDDEL